MINRQVTGLEDVVNGVGDLLGELQEPVEEPKGGGSIRHLQKERKLPQPFFPRKRNKSM